MTGVGVRTRRTRRGLICGTAAWIASRAMARAQIQDVPGLTASSSWESPQFGSLVLWSDTWHQDDANTLSDPVNLLDRLTLLHPGGSTLVVIVIDAGDETASDYARRLVRYRRVTNPEAELASRIDASGSTSLLYRSRIGRQDVVSLIDIRLSDDAALLRVVEMIAYMSDAEASFVSVQADVSIDEDVPYPNLEDFPTERLA